MINTKYAKVAFGRTAYTEKAVVVSVDTCDSFKQKQTEMIKVVERKPGAKVVSGHKRVNFAEIKQQERYRKLNSMLGR